jgi:hypothetical protein
MGEGESVRGRRVWHYGVEGDVVGVGEHERRGRGGKFERSDGRVIHVAVNWSVGSQVPPSVVQRVLGGDSICNCHWTH